MPESKGNSNLLTTLESNWQAEMDDQATYQGFAARELNARRRNVMRGLAATTKHHAELWADRIRALGGPESIYSGKASGRTESFVGLGGVDVALRRLKVDQRHNIVKYKRQLAELRDEPSLEILREVVADEHEHYRALSGLIRTRPPLPATDNEQARQSLANLMAARQKKHPEAAGWMNDAIYAANDGLGSIFGIVAGVAGATLGNSHFILVAGVAGMIGSALTMGTGAYLTAKSEHELFEAGLARERSAVDYDEAEAREVLALNFQIRGLPEEVAISLVHLLAENKERFINALARAQSNLSEETLSTPSVSALVRYGDRRVRSNHPVFLYDWNSGDDCCCGDFLVSSLRCGRGEVVDDRPRMVEHWAGVDRLRCSRGSADLQHWYGFGTDRLA
jgi:vacuolar iron transporter family protein